MPAEGLDWLPDAEVLTDDEVVRLITIGVERLGIARSGSPVASRCSAAAWPTSSVVPPPSSRGPTSR